MDRLKNDNYVALKFSSEYYQTTGQKIVNGLLVDIEEQSIYDIESSVDSNYVEYYFDLRLDSEIPEDDICNGLKLLKREEIFVDMDLDCLERDTISDIDIYATKVTEIEEC